LRWLLRKPRPQWRVMLCLLLAMLLWWVLAILLQCATLRLHWLLGEPCRCWSLRR
jgi:hypothetical protein